MVTVWAPDPAAVAEVRSRGWCDADAEATATFQAMDLPAKAPGTNGDRIRGGFADWCHAMAWARAYRLQGNRWRAARMLAKAAGARSYIRTWRWIERNAP